MQPLPHPSSLERLRWTTRNPCRKMTIKFQPPTIPKINRNEFSSLIMLHNFSVLLHHEPNVQVQISPDLRFLLRSAQCPETDLPSKFRHKWAVSGREICIAHNILGRAAINGRAKNDPFRTLWVVTSPLFEEFPVFALFVPARVVLGSSKVPLEFWGAHPKLRSETRFGDESIENLILKV